MSNIKVLFVCLGNICRSPLAEGIFNHQVDSLNLKGTLQADSCGTAAYHIGAHPDERSRANAKKNGVEYDHLGRQLELRDFYDFDYIIPMDRSNLNNVERLKPSDSQARIILMREFDEQEAGADVPDPYYGGEDGFQQVFEILNRSVAKLIQELKD